MIRSGAWLFAALSCVSAQFAVHHSPVVHNGNAQSFQSFSFGPGSAAQYRQRAPLVQPQQVVVQQRARTPAVRRPAAPAAYVAQPAPAQAYAPQRVVVQSPVQAYAPKPAAVPAPVQAYAPKQVAVPVPVRAYAPKPVAVPARTQAYVAQPAAVTKDYNPDPSTYNYDYKYDADAQPSFTYDPENPEKTFDYKYNYDGPKYEYESADIDINVPAEQLVDSALYETKTQGAKIVRVLQKLTNNKIIARAIASTESSDDPCAFIPSDLDATVEELLKGIGNSRDSLVKVIAAVQDMKRNEDDTVAVIKSASQAVLAIEPMLPIFKKVFKANEACDNSIQATINKFDGVSNVLDTLGRTNLVSRNENDKIRLIQGAQASRAISKTAVNLDKINFMNLCSDSPTFTSDVFKGVGELLNGLKDISASFKAGDSSVDAGKLDSTVRLLKDGAELLSDLNLDEFDANKDYTPSSDCVTSLPDVAKSLAEVADLVDVIEPETLKSLGRR